MAYGRKSLKSIFCATFLQDSLDVGAALKLSTTNQPVLFRCQDRLWVKVDNSAIELADVSCFADAVELLVATFYVFNVEYAFHLKPTFEVIETVMKLRKTPRSSVARELLKVLQS